MISNCCLDSVYVKCNCILCPLFPTDNLRHLDLKGRDCREVENNLKRTFINSDFKTVWTLKSAALVENKALDERYR